MTNARYILKAAAAGFVIGVIVTCIPWSSKFATAFSDRPRVQPMPMTLRVAGIAVITVLSGVGAWRTPRDRRG